MKNNLAVAMGRVSTLAQREKGLSLGDQEAIFRQYANRLGHTIDRLFSFNESASVSQERTNFHEVIRYIKSHDIGHLYIENTTRLSRDIVDMQYIKDLYENHDVTFHFIQENYTLNKNLEGASKWFLFLNLMHGEIMIDSLRKKVKDTMIRKVERGEWPMRPIYGYDIKDKKLVVNERASKYVGQMFRMRADGASLREIADWLNKSKIRASRGVKWGFQSVEKILTQVGYIGKVKWKDMIYDGQHQPIITAALFEKVKKTFTQSTRKNVQNGHLFSGMIRLPSGRLFSPEVQKGRVYYSAYHDDRQRTWLSEEKALGLISPHIAAMHWKSDFGEFVRETARAMVALNHNKGSRLIASKEHEMTLLRGKAVQVYDDKLDGTITKEIYLIKAGEIQARQAELEKELRGLRTDDSKFIEKLDEIVEQFERLPVTYADADNTGKAQILRDLCTGFVYDGDKITIKYKDTFAVFINSKIDSLKRARVRDSSKVRPFVDEFRTLLAA